MLCAVGGVVFSLWPAHERQFALAIDASTLTQRFPVFRVSVMYRGCAIPVAWNIVAADQKGVVATVLERTAEPHAGVPMDWTVLVLSDRGLYAQWLYTHSVSLG